MVSKDHNGNRQVLSVPYCQNMGLPNKAKISKHIRYLRKEIDPQEAKFKQFLDTIKDLVFPHDLSFIGQGQVYAKCIVMSLAVPPVCPGIGVYTTCGTWYIRPDTARPGFSLQLCRRVQWVASGQ